MDGSANGLEAGLLLRPVVLDPVIWYTRAASASALSASSFFQKQAKPVPRDRPVARSIVILAYRRGPNVRNLGDVSVVYFHRRQWRGYSQVSEFLLGRLERQVSDEQR